VTKISRRAYLEMQSFIDKENKALDVTQGDLFSGSKSIRAMGCTEFATNAGVNSYNYHFLTWQVSISTFMWYSIAIRKAALIINIMAIVQLFNSEAGSDPILNIIIFQKTLDIGFVMTGMFHNLTDFERTLIGIQKVFRLLEIP
jgi:hypothetical protein